MPELSPEEEAALAKIQAAARGADVRMAAGGGEGQPGTAPAMSKEQEEAMKKIQAAQRGVEVRSAEVRPMAHMMLPKKRAQRRQLRSNRAYRLVYDFSSKKLVSS